MNTSSHAPVRCVARRGIEVRGERRRRSKRNRQPCLAQLGQGCGHALLHGPPISTHAMLQGPPLAAKVHAGALSATLSASTLIMAFTPCSPSHSRMRSVTSSMPPSWSVFGQRPRLPVIAQTLPRAPDGPARASTVHAHCPLRSLSICFSKAFVSAISWARAFSCVLSPWSLNAARKCGLSWVHQP